MRSSEAGQVCKAPSSIQILSQTVKGALMSEQQWFCRGLGYMYTLKTLFPFFLNEKKDLLKRSDSFTDSSIG